MDGLEVWKKGELADLFCVLQLCLKGSLAELFRPKGPHRSGEFLSEPKYILQIFAVLRTLVEFHGLWRANPEFLREGTP